MRFFEAVAEFLALSAAAGLAVAQAGQKPASSDTNVSQPTVAVSSPIEPKPSAQMDRLLRAFEGTWSIRERLAPDAKSPNGTTGEGRIVWRSGPGGFSVIEDYQSREGSRDITGLGVFWWDDAARGYRTIWCDSTNPGGCINFKNVARWEGPQLILVEDYEINGKKFTFKETFGDITSSAFTQTLYGAESGRELKVDQTIQATRLQRGLPGQGSRN